jgi:hypothetical protein
MTERLMAFDIEPEPVHPRGPFDKEPRGAGLRDRDQRRLLLLQALDGVELGTWDELILNWLTMWEDSTLLTIAGWIRRARTPAVDASPPPARADLEDPVRYGSVTAPTDSQNSTRRCPICGGEPASARATFCSDAHRQAAYRHRQGAPPAPPPRQLRHLVVYQCSTCEERYLGQQRCDQCNLWCRRLGAGGLCVHCDQPVAISDLMAP